MISSSRAIDDDGVPRLCHAALGSCSRAVLPEAALVGGLEIRAVSTIRGLVKARAATAPVATPAEAARALEDGRTTVTDL